MKTIILAAGRGSRMKSLTDERPKCLLEIDGQSLLERQLRALRESGIEQIGIVTGYKRELLKIRARLSAFERDQMQMTHALQRIIEKVHISIKAIPYVEQWGEVDTSEDLDVYQNNLSILGGIP